MCLPYNGKHTLSIHFLMHLHLNRNSFTHLLYVRNNSDFPSLHL